MMHQRTYVNILVDYDNLNIEKADDAPSVIDHISERFLPEINKDDEDSFFDILIRLYGGWYNEKIGRL